MPLPITFVKRDLLPKQRRQAELPLRVLFVLILRTALALLLNLTAKPTSLLTVTALRHSLRRLLRLLLSRTPLMLMHFLSARRTV